MSAARRPLRRAAGLALLCGLAVTSAACGTRLPDSAFAAGGQTRLGQQGGVTGSASGPHGSVRTTGHGTSATGPGTGDAGTSTGPSGASGGAAPAPSGGSSSGVGAGSGGGHQAGTTAATDVGVTATTIRVGNISSLSNPFDPAAFRGPVFGAKAFFQNLNAHGGVNGRKIVFYSCDDRANGAQNQQCVRKLVDDTKVFAFAGNAIFQYDGSSYVQQKGVPDIGGQPIDTAYDALSHLFSIYGVHYPRNGKPGIDGKDYLGTGVYHWFKVHFPKTPLKAGVVYYNQTDSGRYADQIKKGLQAEGYTVDAEPVDFALPDYNSAVIHMKAQGVQYVYDALDAGGNQALCKAMDANGLTVKAKVTTTQGWIASVGRDYQGADRCRNSLWAEGKTRNYEDTRYPPVKAFRAAMARYGYDGIDTMSEWALEGWAAAQWLTDAIRSCGADVTRSCVEAYMNRDQPYDGHNLLTPRTFTVWKTPPKTVQHCFNLARWQDSADGGKGGWVSQVPDMDTNCYQVPNIGYSP